MSASGFTPPGKINAHLEGNKVAVVTIIGNETRVFVIE